MYRGAWTLDIVPLNIVPLDIVSLDIVPPEAEPRSEAQDVVPLDIVPPEAEPLDVVSRKKRSGAERVRPYDA